MKKAITTISIITSLFVFGLFVAPKQSEASFWDHFSIGLGVMFGGSNSGYNNYGYGNGGYYDDSYYNFGGYDDCQYYNDCGDYNYGYGNGYYDSYPSNCDYGYSCGNSYSNYSSYSPCGYNPCQVGNVNYNNYNYYNSGVPSSMYDIPARYGGYAGSSNGAFNSYNSSWTSSPSMNGSGGGHFAGDGHNH